MKKVLFIIWITSISSPIRKNIIREPLPLHLIVHFVSLPVFSDITNLSYRRKAECNYPKNNK